MAPYVCNGDDFLKSESLKALSVAVSQDNCFVYLQISGFPISCESLTRLLVNIKHHTHMS